jgi:hypothetical protein
MAQIKAVPAFMYDVTVMFANGEETQILIATPTQLVAGDTLMVSGGGGKPRLASILPAGIMHPQSAPGTRANPRCYIRRDQTGRAVATA